MAKEITKETWEQTKDFRLDESLEFEQITGKIECKGLKVLDFGCGSGRGSAKLAHRGAEVFGVDILQGNLDNAKKLCDKIKVNAEFKLVGEKDDIPYPDNFFDMIICDGVLHHIPHAQEVMREFRRVLKPKCPIYLMLYTPVLFKIHLNEIINMIRNTPEKTWQRCFGEKTDDCNYSDFYTIADITDILGKNGFNKINTGYFKFGQFMAVKGQ